eukprot:8414829-Alexandrium_andersonii.AAC.1
MRARGVVQLVPTARVAKYQGSAARAGCWGRGDRLQSQAGPLDPPEPGSGSCALSCRSAGRSE